MSNDEKIVGLNGKPIDRRKIDVKAHPVVMAMILITLWLIISAALVLPVAIVIAAIVLAYEALTS